MLPGVRGIKFQGIAPTVMPGRDGSQYVAYVEKNIAEMYQAVDLDEEMLEKEKGQLDPYTLLFRAMKDKKKYQRYSVKFEQLEKEICETVLELSKKYLDGDELIYVIGKKEQVNIAEFKNTTPLCYQIKLEEQTDDVASKLGRQLTFNHILQYVGDKLGRDDIGRLIKNAPFANNEESWGDLTIDYEMVTNDMLAIERGEMPEASQDANADYYIQRLSKRMKEPDFKFLPPPIQNFYKQYRDQYTQIKAKQFQTIQSAKDGLVPTSGAMIGVDFWLPNPSGDPTKQPVRARLPYFAVDWLVKRLDAQGQSIQQLETMNQGAAMQMASHLQNSVDPQTAQQMGQSQPPQQPMQQG